MRWRPSRGLCRSGSRCDAWALKGGLDSWEVSVRGSGGSRASCSTAFLRRCARRLRARACGSAEHPGLKRGAFLIRFFRVGSGWWLGREIWLGRVVHSGGFYHPQRAGLLHAELYAELHAGRARKNGTCLFPVPNSTRASTENWLVPVSRPKQSKKIRVSAMIRLGPGYIFILRRGAHRAGGGKVRLATMIRLGLL